MAPCLPGASRAKIAPDYCQKVFYALAISLGFWQAWANRLAIYQPDAISYLDMAKAFQGDRWNEAISAYWGPLYPLLLSVALRCFRPDNYSAFLLLKLTNFTIYMFLLVSWQVLISELVRRNRASVWLCEQWRGKLELCFRLCAYTLFLWAFLTLGGVYQDTPDLAFSAMFVLSTLCLWRICQGKRSLVNYVLIGFFLGLGYLAKAVMLPLSAVFFVWQILDCRRSAVPLPKVMVSAAVFLCVIGPWICAMSFKYKHFTTGSQAIMAYMCGVSYETNLTAFAVTEEEKNTYTHPPRKISENPVAYAYIGPVGGTYPFWTDPSYWYEGLRLRIDPWRSVLAFVCDFLVYSKMCFVYACVFFIVAGIYWRRNVFSCASFAGNAAFWLPALTGFFLYSLSINLFLWPWVERYFSAFACLFLLGSFSSLPVTDERRGAQAHCSALLTVTALLALQMSTVLGQTLKTPYAPGRLVARALTECGISPGSRLAVLGNFELRDWAFLSGVQAVVAVPDCQAFFACDDVTARAFLEKLKAYNIKAIIHFPHSISSQAIYAQTLMDSRMDQLFSFWGVKRIKKEPKQLARNFYLDRGWRRLADVDCYLYTLK